MKSIKLEWVLRNLSEVIAVAQRFFFFGILYVFPALGIFYLFPAL